MSCKEKRILNQTAQFMKTFSDGQMIYQKKVELENQLKEIDEALHELEHIQEDIAVRLENKNAHLSVEQIPLYDGTEIIVFVVRYDNNFMMYFDGVVAEAKCHPNDEYNEQMGYAICRHRLMEQIMKIKYNI